MVNLGYQKTELPEDVPQWHLNGLKMQRLVAEGDFDALAPILDDALRTLNQSQDVTSLVNQFYTMTGLDEELKRDIADRLVTFVHTENKKHFAK